MRLVIAIGVLGVVGSILISSFGAYAACATGAANARRERAISPLHCLALLRIFSGIQPTGRKHLGNYIGAIRQYVEGQDRGDPAIYCIVNLHAVTVMYEPAELRSSVLDTTAMLLAAGLDPNRCILFRQGDVHEHTELCWLL